jgi:aerobic carbon-monoxide dehydrogenase medium subunit
MKLPPFAYETPETLEEAVALKAEHGDEAVVLAGGQSLIPLLALRLANPAMLIDLNGVRELEYLRMESGTLVLGAMARHRAVEEFGDLLQRLRILADALPLIGHRAIRNRGTVGGSMAHADPAAEWPALALALDGTLEAIGPRGARTVSACEFFLSYLTNALAPDEILRAVRFPLPEERVGSAFVEYARRYGDFAVGGVAAVLSFDQRERVSAARIVLLGMAGTPVRATYAEEALLDTAVTGEDVNVAMAACRASVDPRGDIHGSAEYRRHLVEVLAGRALRLARDRAGVAAG